MSKLTFKRDREGGSKKKRWGMDMMSKNIFTAAITKVNILNKQACEMLVSNILLCLADFVFL